MSKIKVRFLVDKEQKQVVFAEAGSDFVDVLFSFLALPLGKIVQLLNKQSGLESLDNLYQSVEQFDIKYFQTEACKKLLLNPRSAAAILCEDLAIKNIHDLYPRIFYTCPHNECLVNSTCYYTYIKNCPCSRCGKQMGKLLKFEETTSEEGGVFVKAYNYMISYDLRVMPTSLLNSYYLLKELQIKDASILEEKVIDFGTEEVLNLLRWSLVSNNALTEFFFPNSCMQVNVDCSLQIKDEKIANEERHEIMLKLFLNKKNNKVLYAEVGEDFANHLLSFLTLPLGSVFRFLPDSISLGGCVINLYKSAEILGLNYFKSEFCRDMVLIPKLPAFYGLKNQILEMGEIKSRNWTVSNCCSKCYFDNGYRPHNKTECWHGINKVEGIEQNPKSTKTVTDNGEGFMGSLTKFMVSDDLNISPSSFFTVLRNGMNVPISDLVCLEVCMDKNKTRLLLGAMLISKTVLTDVFSPKEAQRKKKQSNHAK